MKSLYLGIMLAICATAPPISAALIATTTLRFDDLPAKTGNNINDVIREQYSQLGVHFNNDGRHSDIVRAGISNGDPGNWDLEGTNGPNFLGHNSFGRTGRIDFDVPVGDFLVDAARGSGALTNLVFEAYGVGGLLASNSTSSPTGVWKTISLSSAAGITRIEYHSTQNFGLDNIRFTSVPETTSAIVPVTSIISVCFVRRRKSA